MISTLVLLAQLAGGGAAQPIAGRVAPFAAPACGAWLLPGALCSWEPLPPCNVSLPYGTACSWETTVHHVPGTAQARIDPDGIPASDMLVAIFVHVPARTNEGWWSIVDVRAATSGPGTDPCVSPARRFTLSLREGAFCLSQ